MPKRTLIRPDRRAPAKEDLPPEPGDNGTPKPRATGKGKCSTCGAKTRKKEMPENRTVVKDGGANLYVAYFSTTRWNSGTGWNRPWEIRGHKKDDPKQYNSYVTCVATRSEAQRVVSKLSAMRVEALREGEESALAQLIESPREAPPAAASAAAPAPAPAPAGTPGDLREAMRNVRSLRAQMGSLRSKLEKEELAHAEDLRLLQDARRAPDPELWLEAHYASEEYQEKVRAEAIAVLAHGGPPKGHRAATGRLPGTEGLVSSLAIPARVVAATAAAADTLATLMVDAPGVEGILFRRDEDGDPQYAGAVCTVQWFRKGPS